MVSIMHLFSINTPKASVFEKLVTLEGLRGWWTSDTTGDPKKGGELRFGFGTGAFDTIRVVDTKENEFVSWKCLFSSFPRGDEWLDTEISFQLKDDLESGTTEVRFEHRGWRAATDFYGICNYHWARFMESLKMLCETGEGMPETEGWVWSL